LVKRKTENCNFCHKKTGGVSMQHFKKNIWSDYFLSDSLKKLAWAGVCGWGGDVSVAVQSQAPRLPISRGAVRVLKRPEQLTRRRRTCCRPSLPYQREVRLLFSWIYCKVLNCVFFLQFLAKKKTLWQAYIDTITE
jgi:hypothetical protein